MTKMEETSRVWLMCQKALI